MNFMIDLLHKASNKTVLLVLTAIFVQACGQTGSLYMPGNPPPIDVPKQDQ